MRRVFLLGLAAFTQACGAPLEQESIAGEVAELSSLPKGQVAVAERSHLDPASLFTSWGWLYYAEPSDPSGPFTLLTKPSNYPRALAAVRIPPACSGDVCSPFKPRQCVFWLDGSANVKSKCETPLNGWGSTGNLSPTEVEGGEIRRLVAVSEPGSGAPALVALNTANKVLVNWYQDGGWAGWCVARTLASSDVLDLAAYQGSSGTLSYMVNRTLSSPTRTVFYRSSISAFSCPNASGNPTSVLTSTVAPLPRFTATSGAVFALDSAGTIVQLWGGQELFTVQPEPFVSMGYRLAQHDGMDWDAFYAISSDGSFWESESPRTVDSAWHREWREVP
jgi:hypothetical protein